jgi:hypothetical protein
MSFAATPDYRRSLGRKSRMAETRIEHVLSCTDDTFWKVFFDPAFNQKLYYEILGFESWKLVSLDDKEDTIERVVDVVPKMEGLPGPLKKLVEGGAGYREKALFTKSKKRLTMTATPTVLEGKLTISGVMFTEPVGADKVRRVYDQSVTAKVFGVGGLIENRIIADVKASYDKATAFTNQWVKDHNL